MIRVTYLRDRMYFDTFDEVKSYYDHEEATSIYDLNEILRIEAEGMESPVIEEVGGINMTVKEVKNLYEGKYEEIEYYTFNGKNHKIHTDTIISYDDEVSDTMMVDAYSLMDEEEYNNTVLINQSLTADFGEWFNNENAKILVIVLR